jgi:hypothetical protein
MSDHSRSSPLTALFESALKDYEMKTDITLTQHPFAEQLENCHSVESITSLLHDKARAFKEFREGERIMKSIEGTVSALCMLSGTAAVGDSIGLVRQRTLMGGGPHI